MTALLEVADLRVTFDGGVQALRGVSFSLQAGESLAIVGESGAGKSTLAHAIVGLVGSPQASGSVRVAGQEVVGADEETLRALRWETVALALQSVPLQSRSRRSARRSPSRCASGAASMVRPRMRGRASSPRRCCWIRSCCSATRTSCRAASGGGRCSRWCSRSTRSS